MAVALSHDDWVMWLITISRLIEVRSVCKAGSEGFGTLEYAGSIVMLRTMATSRPYD
ncbi:MAG: hypothetical protein WBX01_17225 [Nitrososphaeraceae archaeon]